MNVGYADINTQDAATMLGVQQQTVTNWCRQGHIRFFNVSDGNKKPRYLFTDDEINRVSKLIDNYGKYNWVHYNDIIEKKPEEENQMEEVITEEVKPEEYIVDDTDEVVNDIKKLRELKIQRDKMLAELDNIDATIKSLRQKIIESI